MAPNTHALWAALLLCSSFQEIFPQYFWPSQAPSLVFLLKSNSDHYLIWRKEKAELEYNSVCLVTEMCLMLTIINTDCI